MSEHLIDGRLFTEPPFRLSDRTVALVASAAKLDDSNEAQITLHLAREVQSSRRMTANLLALHEHARAEDYEWCDLCAEDWPCPTVRLIEGAQW